MAESNHDINFSEIDQNDNIEKDLIIDKIQDFELNINEGFLNRISDS